MGLTRTVYASIGNPDDRLPQHRWSIFHRKFVALIRHHALEVFGEWASAATSHQQSACVGFEIGTDDVPLLRHDLTSLAGEYQQDHIVWADAKTHLLHTA